MSSGDLLNSLSTLRNSNIILRIYSYLCHVLISLAVSVCTYTRYFMNTFENIKHALVQNQIQTEHFKFLICRLALLIIFSWLFVLCMCKKASSVHSRWLLFFFFAKTKGNVDTFILYWIFFLYLFLSLCWSWGRSVIDLPYRWVERICTGRSVGGLNIANKVAFCVWYCRHQFMSFRVEMKF